MSNNEILKTNHTIFSTQLSRLLPNPLVTDIRNLCRRHLDIHLNPDEAEYTSDALLGEVPLFSNEIRVAVWKALLLDGDNTEAWTVSLDLPHQEMIAQDCSRCRLEELEGKQELLEQVEYKQGLCHLLAPFFLLLPDESPMVIWRCFDRFLSRFVPVASNFEGLRCVFQMFRILLLYHDPALFKHIEKAKALPEQYAISWFSTLFASKLPIAMVALLWDVYLIEDDPFLHMCIALALVIRNREHLLQIDNDELPLCLAALQLQNLSSLVEQARSLYEQSPSCFRQLSREDLSTKRFTSVYMGVPASFLVGSLNPSEERKFNFLVLDTRPKHDLAGRLCLSTHLDSSLPSSPESLELQFGQLRDMHFCFVGGSDPSQQKKSGPDATTKMFLAAFRSQGFKHLSYCLGGYYACHEWIVKNSLAPTLLIDHQDCVLCHTGPSTFSKLSSLLPFASFPFSPSSYSSDNTTSNSSSSVTPSSAPAPDPHVAPPLVPPLEETGAARKQSLTSSRRSSLPQKFQLDEGPFQVDAVDLPGEATPIVRIHTEPKAPASPKSSSSSIESPMLSLSPPSGSISSFLASPSPESSACAPTSPCDTSSITSFLSSTTPSATTPSATSSATSSTSSSAASSTHTANSWRDSLTKIKHGTWEEGASVLSGFKAFGSHLMRRPQQTHEPEPTIDLSEWSADNEVQLFECYDLQHEARVLAVTPGYIVLLAPTSPPPAESLPERPLNPTFTGPAVLKTKKQLSELKRITSNKEFPGLLSFVWKEGDPLRLRVINFAHCIQVVRLQVQTRKTGVEDF